MFTIFCLQSTFEKNSGVFISAYYVSHVCLACAKMPRCATILFFYLVVFFFLEYLKNREFQYVYV
jgi:hypothetical protein